jgi:hypothetical protein
VTQEARRILQLLREINATRGSVAWHCARGVNGGSDEVVLQENSPVAQQLPRIADNQPKGIRGGRKVEGGE